MNVFVLEHWISLVLLVGLTAVKAFAFVNAVTFSSAAYEAAGKLTKPAWLAILGLGLGTQLLLAGSPTSLIHLVFTIAAFVYLADVRPALAEMTRRR